MYVCIYVCMYVLCVYVCMYVQVLCMCVCMYVCMYKYYVCVCVCMYVCTSMYVCVCVCVCVCTHFHIIYISSFNSTVFQPVYFVIAIITQCNSKLDVNGRAATRKERHRERTIISE